MASLAEENARLMRLAAYMDSDERIVERAKLWRDATPAECLASLDELCLDGELLQGCATSVELESEPLPGDTLAILEALWQSRLRDH